ncbi:MAG: hypothetical protein MUE41_04330 [Gemmatimonadaceae bacterium]|jgi:hypothetical protein|nr:hypothetical protein [Gemmatimonadaceae bacterium]
MLVPLSHPERPVKDNQLAKLLKQTQQKAEKAINKRPSKTYDPTLVTKKDTEDADIDRQKLFKELKRREF